MLRIGLFLVLVGLAHPDPGDGKPPSGKALRDLVREYLRADASGRAEIRARMDAEIAPLEAGRALDALRKDLLRAAAREGPRVEARGTNWFWERPEKRGKYIASGKPGKALFLGLHGGGEGEGSAESAAGAMGGGGWWWIFPEVLEKTARGWTDSGTEEFVLELIQAAKRTGAVDPNRIYITGHSMGGYGTWTVGAHHADVFAGAAAYAGAATPVFASPEDRTVVGIDAGVIPNLLNVPIFVFQSTDDPRVPPESNQFAAKDLARWKEKHPEGFEHRYVEVDDRGHAAPAEGYLPSLKWIASHERIARPKKVIWQPILDWKRQFYWVYWEAPQRGIVLQVEAREGNAIDVSWLEGSAGTDGLSLLLGEPLVDLSKEVVVRVAGEERFRGIVPRTFSTLLLTLPREDADLLFDARVDF